MQNEIAHELQNVKKDNLPVFVQDDCQQEDKEQGAIATFCF